MTPDVLARIDRAAREACGLDPARPLITAVSGGADSLCLLDSLHALGFSLVVAHFDHRLRPDSAGDARFVEAEAARRGLPFAGGSGEVAALARDEHLSIEEAARLARYRFLFDEAQRYGAQAVATGHTADDQVETVLMHLLRGAGLSGLKGMLPRAVLPLFSTDLPFVRPLLDVWREETLAWCAARGLQPREDPTNRDPAFTRNRLRLTLLPTLEALQPSARRSLWRSARALRGDFQLLQSLEDETWTRLAPRRGAGWVALELDALGALPDGLRRRILRRAVACLRPALRDLDLETVERGLAFLDNPTRSGQMDLALGLCLSREGSELIVHESAVSAPPRGVPQLARDLEIPVEVPGEILLGNGYRLRAESLPVQALPADWQSRGAQECWLDGEAARIGLTLRGARLGERFSPLGMGGQSLKLSDLWINLHVPRAARAGWPLLCAGDTIYWVVGLRPGQAGRITPASREVIHLSLLAPESAPQS